jgi:putative transposase
MALGFGYRGCDVSIGGRNKNSMEAYIRNQLQEDRAEGQLTIKEFVDLVMGKPEEGS